MNNKEKISAIQSGDEEKLDALIAAIEATHDISASDRERSLGQRRHKDTYSFSYATHFGGDNSKFHSIIKECVEIYYTTPQIRNIIDLMTDFASENLKIDHRIPSQQRFFRSWVKKTKFNETVRKIFQTIFLCANCFVVRQEGKVDEDIRRRLSSAGLGPTEVVPSMVPIGYTILNPTRINIESTELFGEREMLMQLSPIDVDKISHPTSVAQKKMVDSFTQAVKDKIIGSGMYPVDQSKLTNLYYKKLDWQSWAYPLIFSAIDDINTKKMFKQMDEASAADVIKAVVIFRLGKVIDGFAPDRDVFSKFASLVKSVSGAKNIVWNDLVDIVTTYPPIEKILGSEKYSTVDKDILSNFGVSEILVTGASGNYSSGFLSVRSLVEKLESIREIVLNEFVTPELERVALAVGFTKMPTAHFGNMSLKDEESEKRILMALVDRKIISVETMQEAMAIDPTVEVNRIKREKKNKDIKVLSPFDPKPTTGTNGRPPSSKTPQQEKRQTKPQGLNVASVLDSYVRTYRYLSNMAASSNRTISEDSYNSCKLLAAVSLLSGDSISDYLSESVAKERVSAGKEILSGNIDVATSFNVVSEMIKSGEEDIVIASAILEIINALT